MVIWGYDADNRPALYLRPSKQNTEESIRQVHFVVWALERLTELMGPGVECVPQVNCLDIALSPLALGRLRSWSTSRIAQRIPPSTNREL